MTTEQQTLSDDKMRAEIAKLIAETAKLNSENRYYPLIVGAASATALIAFARLVMG